MVAGDASVEKILADNTYRYNKNGQRTEKTTLAGTTKYTYNVLGQLIQENNHIYTYDRAGKLVSFIYADREVITEEDEAGEHIRYIRGHELLASDSAHARTYYHYACDEMGSITDITDTNGTVLNHYAYDAFGNRTVEEESVENRFGFAGEMLDAVTGQYYLRARFYNPVIARFLSEDTYYGDGLNLYAYCYNNPVGYVDPSGHIKKICSKKYAEHKQKEAEGGKLSLKEKYQIYEYEHRKTQPDGVGSDSKRGIPSGYYQDANGRWHRPNGQFASNAEVGIDSPVKVSTGSHGNSLSDPRTNYGYVLVDRDTNNILKFGETLYPETRYSKSYLEQNNAVMKVLESVSKEYIHNWQHDLNMYFKSRYGDFPLLNKGGW